MKKIVLAFTMLLATVGMAFAQADLQPIVTVKLGKSETITLKQLKSRVGLFERQANKKLSAEERKSVLEAFVDEKLILQAAAKAGLAIPDSQSDQYFLQTMMQQIGVPFSSEKELEDIILKTQGVSLDQFLYRTLIFLREANSISFASMQGYKENSKSLSEIYEVFKKSMSSYSDVVQQVDCLPNFLNSLKIEGEELLLKYNKRFYRVFKKRDLINRALYINASMCENQDYLTYLVCIAKIKNLYKEAIKNVYLPPKEEIINRIVIDIEKHLQWKLSEKFFFISYSTKDTLKAETLRSKIQRFGFLVWIAPDGIPQGMDYSLVIPTTLKMTKNFILLLTENSATSKWVMREIDTAINNEQTKLRILLTNGFGVKKISEYNDLEFYLK
mgnify:CR=1 FL=1